MRRSTLLALALCGCEGTLVGGAITPGETPVDPDEVEPTPTSSIDPPKYVQARCEGAPPARTYRGFGGEALEGDRADHAKGLEGRRTSLYESVDFARGHLDDTARDFEFSLGFFTSQTGNAFGLRELRWSSEPTGSALLLASQFRISFLSCQRRLEQKKGFAANVDYHSLPSPETARARCVELATRFWNTRPSEEQLAECVSYATVETASETVPARRWAYVCANLLSTTFVLTH